MSAINIEKENLLDLSTLYSILNYDSTTGIFTNKVRRGPKLAGSTAGTTNFNGYRVIKIAGRTYYAHRLAWLYMNKEWPSSLIDHIDGNKLNNAINNLRLATSSQNGLNTGINKVNTSGYKGIHKIKNKYMVRITHNKTRIYLGVYSSLEEARIVYENNAKLLHGEFYREEST